MHFGTKSYLKSNHNHNHNHTAKHAKMEKQKNIWKKRAKLDMGMHVGHTHGSRV